MFIFSFCLIAGASGNGSVGMIIAGRFIGGLGVGKQKSIYCSFMVPTALKNPLNGVPNWYNAHEIFAVILTSSYTQDLPHPVLTTLSDLTQVQGYSLLLLPQCTPDLPHPVPPSTYQK